MLQSFTGFVATRAQCSSSVLYIGFSVSKVQAMSQFGDTNAFGSAVVTKCTLVCIPIYFLEDCGVPSCFLYYVLLECRGVNG